MRKFLPFSRRQPSLDRYTVNRVGLSSSDRFSVKSLRRTSASSLNGKSIQVVRGAYNIDLNKVDSSFSKLHRACLLNDDTQVRKHLHKIDNNSHDSSNRYPIHLATVNGNFAIVKLLIENNANPNVQDNEDNTPLIKSIECGHERLVKFLLNHGADPNLSDQNNNTALHWAIMTESIIAIEALLNSKKCDLSLRNNKDETCLHLAVRSPLINTSTFESMIRNGSDLQAKDQLGLTPLDIAQASMNSNALTAIDSHRSTTENPHDTSSLGDQVAKQVTTKNMYEEYKLKYMNKNRENLEFETKVIHLENQIERLKVDIIYLREQNEKLVNGNGRLLEENSKLKLENSRLLDRTSQNKQKQNAITKQQAQPIREEAAKKKNLEIDSTECRSMHEQFLKTKAIHQERINKLKYGLN